MKRYFPIFACGTAILLAGCSSVETVEVVKPAVPLRNPWRETDSFSQSRNVVAGSRLPVTAVAPGKKPVLSTRVDYMLRKAAFEGSREAEKLLGELKKNANDETAIRQALETVVLFSMRAPLNEKYVTDGIEIAAKSGRYSGRDFAPPSVRQLFAAKKKNDRSSQVVLLYQERCELRTYIFTLLKECGLERKDIYWVPLYTYLELELLGIEQEFRKIAAAGSN